MKPLLWVLPALLLVSNLHYSCFVDGAPQVPCYFIFGDSLSDSGNNNGPLTLAKANYKPYGIDFPRGPTGRFSNGRNLVDVIASGGYDVFTAELLGFSRYIPPFATAIGSKILNAVNYASGAAGIREESGRNQGMRITFYKRLVNHQNIVRQIVYLQGNNNSAAIQYLGKCIYTVAIGTNDYINNYFMPRLYSTSRQFTPEQYAGVLIQQYSGQIKTLYNSGARKIALFGLGTIGSIPFEVAMCNSSTNNVSLCSDNINSAVQVFNARLQSLVADLNSDLTDAKFTYIDFYRIGLSSAAASLGSVIFDAPCCEVVRETGLCVPFKTPCQNRTQYSFWDAIHPSESSNVVHPSESSNVVLGGRAYNAALPTDAVPFDINQLAQA